MMVNFRKSNLNRHGLRSRSRGQMAAVIGFLALVVLSVGLFSFEVGRANLANQQLQNVTDAAALAGAATLASEDNTNPTNAHNDAVQTALNLFKQNLVMGQTLTNTTVAGAAHNVPAPGDATMFFEFLNPLTRVVEPVTSPNGKIVRINADFGLEPAFGRFLGLGAISVHAVATSAVPQLDIVICFDISGSMDDQTPVTIVKRKWNPTLTAFRAPPPGSPASGRIEYVAPPSANGTNGKIFDVQQPGPNGSSLNVLQPQYLSYAYANNYLYFSIPWAAFYGVQDLRSGGVYPDAGLPPGNFPPGTAPTWDGWPVYTDMVGNLDNNTTFAGFSSGGFNFPDIATLVEASRGNLENTTVFNSSQAWSSVNASVNPQPGYQAKYFQLAADIAQPMKDAKAACRNFLDIINTDTDAHFGFVAFDAAVGASPADTETVFNIDQCNFAGMPNFGAPVAYPRPLVPLDPIPANTNYASALTALNSCVSIGGTNIGAAIQAAVTELTTHQRTGAVRAIVLFTDGQATNGNPLDPNPATNARLAAALARDSGIPVYTIGLAQDTTAVAGQTAILNDTDSNPSSGGIAAISGHGATFNAVMNSPQLTNAFEKIARCLVQLVSNG